jgi:hypothetical protein
VRSRQGEGSTFTLVLPRVPPQPGATETTPATVVGPPARPEGILS